MFRIAVLEDDPQDGARLERYLARYQKEHSVVFQVFRSDNGLAFIEHYQANYDVILLDIEMPRINGMKLAHLIREKDQDVCLIFTTGLAQYAVEGYEVRALDYIIKPVEYPNFALKLQRALGIRQQQSMREIYIAKPNGMYRLRIEDIHYIEVVNHTLYYHTGMRVYEERGVIGQREKELEAYGFARCSTSFLLNLRYVTSVQGNVVISDGKEFTMTRSKRKEFLKRLADYLGENNL